jgi:hypothetical protein
MADDAADWRGGRSSLNKKKSGSTNGRGGRSRMGKPAAGRQQQQQQQQQVPNNNGDFAPSRRDVTAPPVMGPTRSAKSQARDVNKNTRRYKGSGASLKISPWALPAATPADAPPPPALDIALGLASAKMATEGSARNEVSQQPDNSTLYRGNNAATGGHSNRNPQRQQQSFVASSMDVRGDRLGSESTAPYSFVDEHEMGYGTGGDEDLHEPGRDSFTDDHRARARESRPAGVAVASTTQLEPNGSVVDRATVVAVTAPASQPAVAVTAVVGDAELKRAKDQLKNAMRARMVDTQTFEREISGLKRRIDKQDKQAREHTRESRKLRDEVASAKEALAAERRALVAAQKRIGELEMLLRRGGGKAGVGGGKVGGGAGDGASNGESSLPPQRGKDKDKDNKVSKKKEARSKKESKARTKASKDTTISQVVPNVSATITRPVNTKQVKPSPRSSTSPVKPMSASRARVVDRVAVASNVNASVGDAAANDDSDDGGGGDVREGTGRATSKDGSGKGSRRRLARRRKTTGTPASVLQNVLKTAVQEEELAFQKRSEQLLCPHAFAIETPPRRGGPTGADRLWRPDVNVDWIIDGLMEIAVETAAAKQCVTSLTHIRERIEPTEGEIASFPHYDPHRPNLQQSPRSPFEVDNREDRPFTPRIRVKPHASVPLCRDELRSKPWLSPYRHEIGQVAYTEWQLGRPQGVDPRQMIAARAPNHPCVWVNTDKSLRRLVKELASAKEVAVDLEQHSERSFQGFLCLMQISTRSTDYIVDVLCLQKYMYRLSR